MRVTTRDHRPARAVVRPSARRGGRDVLVVTDDNDHRVVLALDVEHVTRTILTTALDDTSADNILNDLNGA